MYLIFEDLSVKGYRNENRRSGLNYRNYKILLTKLAKYHAVTAVLGVRVSK